MIYLVLYIIIVLVNAIYLFMQHEDPSEEFRNYLYEKYQGTDVTFKDQVGNEHFMYFLFFSGWMSYIQLPINLPSLLICHILVAMFHSSAPNRNIKSRIDILNLAIDMLNLEIEQRNNRIKQLEKENELLEAYLQNNQSRINDLTK